MLDCKYYPQSMISPQSYSYYDEDNQNKLNKKKKEKGDLLFHRQKKIRKVTAIKTYMLLQDVL